VNKYPWQQTVSDAFKASPEALPAKINAAEKAIAARLGDPKEPDASERAALDQALLALRGLIEQSRNPVSERRPHFHIRWSGGALDHEAFGTRAAAEASANDLVLPNERYTIEEYGDGCPRCSELTGKKAVGA
jgi:hypothetical protein